MSCVHQKIKQLHISIVLPRSKHCRTSAKFIQNFKHGNTIAVWNRIMFELFSAVMDLCTICELSVQCVVPPRMQSALDLPMAMRYRNLQKTYKQHVGVFQSGIHGLGLYCIREIEPGEMVIEYAGTVIRSVLTDKREKLYESKVCVCGWLGVGG